MEPSRRFEYAVIENIYEKASVIMEILNDPQSWEELAPDPRLDELLERWTEIQPPTVDEPHEDDFYLFVGDDFLCCRPDVKLPHSPIWIYSVRAEDPAAPPHLQTAAFDEARQVPLREVPPTFVLTCGLAEIAPGRLQAKFTTLAGELMMCVQCPSPADAALLTMSACEAAAHQGRLLSRNQEVCVLLEGESEPLGIEKVPDLFWSWLEMI